MLNVKESAGIPRGFISVFQDFDYIIWGIRSENKSGDL